MNYDIILADPPWKYAKAETGGSMTSGASYKYPVMELQDILDLRVGEHAKDNSILFLWGTWPLLPEAIKTIEHWGFRYITIGFVWVKATRGGLGFFTGMGYYTRGNTEFCLIGKRGSMPVTAHDVSQLIYAPVREHSRKPDEQYGKIERLYPNMKYLELFARKTREGWDSWGNEVETSLPLFEAK